MKTIGVREAKGRLSRLLRDVRRGGEWIITDRGVPIAKLSPLAETETLSERIARIEESGSLRPLSRKPRPLPPPLPLTKNLAQRFLQEDRSRA
jgi:prevent-host-death family protein